VSQKSIVKSSSNHDVLRRPTAALSVTFRTLVEIASASRRIATTSLVSLLAEPALLESRSTPETENAATQAIKRNVLDAPMKPTESRPAVLPETAVTADGRMLSVETALEPRQEKEGPVADLTVMRSTPGPQPVRTMPVTIVVNPDTTSTTVL
jgi:hypothetical protein